MITTVGKMIEEEKKKYAEEKVEKIVKNLIAKGFDATDIAQITEDVSIARIKEIKKELN